MDVTKVKQILARFKVPRKSHINVVLRRSPFIDWPAKHRFVPVQTYILSINLIGPVGVESVEQQNVC